MGNDSVCWALLTGQRGWGSDGGFITLACQGSPAAFISGAGAGQGPLICAAFPPGLIPVKGMLFAWTMGTLCQATVPPVSVCLKSSVCSCGGAGPTARLPVTREACDKCFAFRGSPCAAGFRAVALTGAFVQRSGRGHCVCLGSQESILTRRGASSPPQETNTHCYLPGTSCLSLGEWSIMGERGRLPLPLPALDWPHPSSAQGGFRQAALLAPN